MTQRGPTYQVAWIATCGDCGGRAIEHVRSTGGDRTHVQLTCEDCGADGRIDYPVGEPPRAADCEAVVDPEHGLVSWVDCPRCHGGGWVEDRGLASGREACPRCHTTGSVIHDATTDLESVPDAKVVG